MSGEINRVPRGLLSLLDMAARGQVPRLLSSEVSGSIELLELYLLQRRESRAGTLVVSAVGQFIVTATPVTVPQNEIWYVWNETLRPTAALVGAGGLIRFAGGHLINPNSRPYQTTETLSYQAQAGDLPAVTAQKPFWLGPGDQAVVWVHEYTAFAPDPTINFEMLISRLEV